MEGTASGPRDDCRARMGVAREGDACIAFNPVRKRSVVDTSAGPYPRPLLERSHWMSLDGTWRFSFDPQRRYEDPAEIEHWPHAIRVPFPPESIASGIGDTSFHPACWYE